MRSLALTFTLLAPLVLGACVSGTVVPSMRYSSTRYVKRIPVSAEVHVSIGSFLVDERARSDSDRKLLADSLRSSFEADLKRNGPFWMDPQYPEVRVEVTVDASAVGDTTAWRYLPPWVWWVVGLPTYSTDIVLTGNIRVLAGGSLITEATARADCTSRTGLYYNWSVELGCASSELMEELRGRLSKEANRIVAAANASPRPGAEVQVAKGGAATGAIVAVFDVEDATKKLDSELVSQLSSYVAVRITEVAGYRVVPRDQLRARIREEKAEGFKACYDESCQLELGKALAAQKSLATKIMRVGTGCTLSATLYDLETETTERGATAKSACEPEALMGAVDRLVGQLAR